MSTTLPKRRRRPVQRAGVILIAIVALLCTLAFTGIPFTGPDTVKVRATFRDVSNVRANQPVRIKGVEVGKVAGVELLDGGRAATVTMKVDQSDAKLLRSDARATIWWRTLLGRNMYVALDLGSARTPLGSATIPVSRTDHQIELDQVLRPLTPTVRQSIRDAIGGFGEGLSDAHAVQASADASGPALRNIGKGLPALRGETNGDLGRLIDGASQVTTALDRDEAALGGIIDSGDQTFAVLAARRSDLAATLQRAPQALATTRTGLARINTTLDKLDPVVRDLRPASRKLKTTVDRLTPALAATTPLLRKLQPLLITLRPALTSLNTLAREGVPLAAQLLPVAERLRTDILPWLASTDPETQRAVYQTIAPTISVLDSSAENYDALGHGIRFQGGSGSRLFEGVLPCSVYVSEQKVTCNNLTTILGQLLGGGGK